LGSVLRQDTGFIGHDPFGIVIERPFKKPIGHELTFSQLIYNQLLSPMRVVIEHANSGVKRLKIIKDIVRLHSTQIRDKIMAVAAIDRIVHHATIIKIGGESYRANIAIKRNKIATSGGLAN